MPDIQKAIKKIRVIQLTTSQLNHALSPFLSQDFKKYFLEMTFTPSTLLIIFKEV